MILADKIIQLRKKNGWSQEELAEKLNVSRQAVSKWESAQSVPDLDKILSLSKIFGISTDFLLKDELEEPEYVAGEDEASAPEVKRVSMEEANSFLAIKAHTAKYIAIATFLCVLSPIALLALGAGAEMGRFSITENAAGGIGLSVMFILVAIAVAMFISCGMKTSQYQYLETDNIELEYGVAGMVKERKKAFAPTYSRYNIIATCLCILSVVPMFACLAFTEDAFTLVCCVCILLFLVAVAVILFIIAGVNEYSFDKLLQEGDYTVENKKHTGAIDAVGTCYWLIAVAIYVGIGFNYDAWWREPTSILVFIIAGILFPIVLTITKAILRNR